MPKNEQTANNSEQNEISGTHETVGHQLNPQEEANTPPPSSPTKWWQYALMYPTAFIALFGSFPTLWNIFQSYRLDIPVVSVGQFVGQVELFKKNFDCIKTQDFENITTKTNTDVGAIVCVSGDTLIKVEKGDWDTSVLRWVGIDTFQKVAYQDIIGQEAYASSSLPRLMDTDQLAATVICQYWDGKYLVRKMKTQNRCYEYVINPGTGKIIQKRNSNCNPC